jgi:hypothetical protein
MNLLSLSILTLAMVPLMAGFSRDDIHQCSIVWRNNKEYERSLMMADWSPMLATTRQVIFVQQQRLLHRPMGFVQPGARLLLLKKSKTSLSCFTAVHIQKPVSGAVDASSYIGPIDLVS